MNREIRLQNREMPQSAHHNAGGAAIQKIMKKQMLLAAFSGYNARLPGNIFSSSDLMKLLIVVFVLVTGFYKTAQANQPAFTGPNYSGKYSCEGENQKVGKYKVDVTLRLNLVASSGRFGAYEYTAETENGIKFYGNAVSLGNQLAASYYLDTVRRKGEPTTALATARRVSGGRWSLRVQYFEPDDFGGNNGSETCMMQPPEKKKPVSVNTP